MLFRSEMILKAEKSGRPDGVFVDDEDDEEESPSPRDDEPRSRRSLRRRRLRSRSRPPPGSDSIRMPPPCLSTMRADRAPLVPVYDDAPAKFRAAVRAIEAAPLAPAPDALARVTAEARPRDALTVLMLSDIEGLPRDPRTTLLRRLAEVQPPPSPQTVARVVAGDRDAFWTWFDSLPLPSLKNWWANWQDVFPR